MTCGQRLRCHLLEVAWFRRHTGTPPGPPLKAGEDWRELYYPFKPVSEIPSMNVRCVRKKANKMGTVIMVLTAIRYG